MPSDATLYVIIAVTLFGFLALAFVLLFPVYRFLKRQEQMADDWTPDALSRRARRPAAPPSPPDDGPAADR